MVEICFKNAKGKMVSLLTHAFCKAHPVMIRTKGATPKALVFCAHAQSEGAVEIIRNRQIGGDHWERVHPMDAQLSRVL